MNFSRLSICLYERIEIKLVHNVFDIFQFNFFSSKVSLSLFLGYTLKQGRTVHKTATGRQKFSISDQIRSQYIMTKVIFPKEENFLYKSLLLR